MIWILIILLLFLNLFSWICGFAFANRFKSPHNFVNYLQSKPEWPTKTVGGHEGEAIYAKDRNEAMALARKHKLRIADRDVNIDLENVNHTQN